MTFPARYNAHRLDKSLIKPRFDRRDIYGLFQQDVTTLQNRTVRAYKIERTLCDILRPNANVDQALISDAYKRWADKPDRNVYELSRCAQMLGVEEKVRSYLEVLL